MKTARLAPGSAAARTRGTAVAGLFSVLLCCSCGGGNGRGEQPEAETSSGARPAAEARAARGASAALAAQAAPADLKDLESEVASLKRLNAQLRTKVDRLRPKGSYIVINTTLNRLTMYKGSEVLVDAVCSTGSNTELIEPNGRRRWFFSTPRGVHTVKRKMIAPVWVKPDWAFVEEGEPVPGATAEERFEEGVLGRYGLYFGNGYLIHGTLFQRFLGQSVTHGCVRLGDADLEKVYENASPGTKIYIY